MTEENITTNIVVNSNFTSLIADLNKVSSSLMNLKEQLNVTNKTLASQISAMNRTFSETLRSTGQFSTHFVSLSSDVDKFGKQLDSGQMKLGQFFRTFNQHTKTSGGLVRDLAKQQVQLQNSILQPLGRNAEGLMQYNVQIPRGLDMIKNKAAIARQELQIMNKVVQEGANSLINWGKNTQWAGRQLTVGLTVPMAAFGKAAADAFNQADQQLVRLTKVYGGLSATSSSELLKVRKDVSATAADIAKSYGQAYKDTISLAADIAATGKTGNELLNSTRQTSRLAILGETNVQDAMKATLSIQNTFKQSTDELTQSIDFLNAVENQTSTTMGDLITAIPKAGPVINAMGGSVKDLALMLVAMKEGGIDATTGANALKSALASLINPTKVAVNMFQGFGINLKDIVTKNAGNLTGTILELQGALDKLNPLQKQQAIEQLFGKFQFARMNALFANLGKQGSQTLQVMDLMKASSQDLANIAGRELAQVTESASGKYRRAVEGLKADLASIGEQFLKINTTLINVVDGIIKFTSKLPKPLKDVLGFLGLITAAAGPLIMLTGVLANFFGYVVKGIFHMKSLFKGGEGWKLLTPEILAANKAASLVEQTFYSDAKAASILQQALAGLAASYQNVAEKASVAAVPVTPGVSTVSGNPIITNGRVANPNNPLIGPIDTRAAGHHNPRSMMTETEKVAQTIHSVTPTSIPLNQKIGAVPQIFATGDMPKVEGLTTSRGASVGIVAQEAAKWHTMMGVLSMQTKTEVAALKKEIAQTGTVSAEFMQSYSQLLPSMEAVTQNAAEASALIVKQVQVGELNVQQGRAAIMAENVKLETLMAQATQQVAADLGRTANLTTVPLINQPIVSSTGKSNIKELFKKGRGSKTIIDKIASALGVKTWGGGYATETTIPKRLNQGNLVPGTGNQDTVPAMLTPGEFVVNKKATEQNLGLLMSINGGNGSRTGINHNTGGQIRLERSHVAEGSASDLNKVRSTRGYGNAVSVGKGIPIWMTRDANQETRSVGRGMTGPQLAKEFRKAISAGHHPFEPWMSASDSLGGSTKNHTQFNKVFNEMLVKLERDNSLFGGKNGDITFEKWFEKNVIKSNSLDSIRVGSRSFKSIFNSVLQPMGPRDGKEIAALETLVKSRSGLDTIAKSNLSGVAKGLLGTFSGKSYNSARQILSSKWAKIFLSGLKRNSGGIIPGYALGGKIVPKLAESVIAKLTAKWKAKKQFYPQGMQYTLGNQDPLHGPLQIGKAMHVGSKAQFDPWAKDPYARTSEIAYNDPQFSRMAHVPGFPIGTLEDRGKYITRQYMEGNYGILNTPGAIEAMRAVSKKFTGTLFRGILLSKNNKSNPLPVHILDLIAKSRMTGDYSGLMGKEFIMRRSSWSSSQDVASMFAPGRNVNDNALLLEAAVKNRNVVPASDMFPNAKFSAPFGQKLINNSRSEKESIFGGKFRIVSAGPGKLKLETVVDGTRANGGPVSGGKSYLVGEKGPELFVPRNSGGIIPNHKVGGIVKNLALPIGMQMLAPTVGSKVGGMLGGSTGAAIGSGIGQVAAFAAMFMGFGNSANKAEGSVGKLAGTIKKLSIFIANLNPYIKGFTIAITAGLVIWNKLHSAQKETDRLNRLAFAGGIKPIKDFDSQIKEIRKNIVAANQAREAFLATKTSAGVSGIQITVKELKDLQVEMKKSYPEIIKMLNQTSMAGLKDTAAGLKAQFIQAGDAADVANKKVLALLTSSNKASNVGTALSSSSFNSMNDLAGANKFSLNNLSKAQSLGNAGFVGQLLQTFTGLDAAVSNSKDKISGVSKQFDAINSSQSKNLKLTKDQLKELSKTNPQLSSILSTSDSIGDAYAKWRIILSGVSKDLSGLTSGELQNLAKYTSEVSGYFNSLSDVSSKAAQSGIFGGLAKQIDTLNKASATSSKISSSIQTSLQDQIKLKQKQIQQIQDEASARKKALQDQQTIEDTKLQIQQEQLNYQNALASGDMASAAQAQLAIQKLVGQQQLNIASDAIDKMAQSKVDKLQAEIEKLQAKSDTTTTTASNTSTAQTNAATKLKALYDELNQLTQSINLHGGSATEGDTIAFNDIIERLKKAGASASVLKQLNPSGGGSTYSGGGMKPTLNATQDLQSLASKSNDKVISNTGQTVKELVAIQTILKNRSDIGTGSGTKADPFTVAPVGASSKGRSLISAANLNKDGTLTARGITDVIITNKLKKGQYFNYAGKTYKVNYDGSGMKFNEFQNDASVVTKAIGGKISGPGTGTSDSIPAMLSHGEYVVNAASASSFGYTNLDNINKMAAGGLATRFDIPKMALGGKVNMSNAGLATNSNSMYNINVNVNGSNADAKDIAYAIRKEMQLRDAMNGRDRTK